MTNLEATDELRYAINLIKQDGKDWLDERDIPVLEMAISALQAQEAKTQLSAEGTTSDLISRQAVIDVCDNAIDLWHGQLGEGIVIAVKKKIEELPSAQPEIKPISYQDCANAMMMMWIDNVLTDGEYRRIMDKLNDHESRRENR